VRERGWTGSVWPTQIRAGWVQPARWAGLGQWTKAQLQIEFKLKLQILILK
jgi:hypothetical protein